MLLGAHLANMYQYGYVTRDIEKGMALFKKKYGIREFLVMEPNATAELNGKTVPFHIHVALANVNDKQIELIQPVEGVTEFYQKGLDLDRSAVVLHHVGILIDGPESAWDVMFKDMAGAGYPVVLKDLLPADAPMRMHFAYADARADLGHYLEFLWRDEVAQKWHESIPNQAV